MMTKKKNIECLFYETASEEKIHKWENVHLQYIQTNPEPYSASF